MVMIMPRRGSVASLVASPRMSNVEQPSSKDEAMIAAISGGSPGSLYSSLNSAIVVSHPRTFWRPVRKKTPAMASRKSSWCTLRGKRPRNDVTAAIRARKPVAPIMEPAGEMTAFVAMVVLLSGRECEVGENPVLEQLLDGAYQVEGRGNGQGLPGCLLEHDPHRQGVPKGICRRIEYTNRDHIADSADLQACPAGREVEELRWLSAFLVGAPDLVHGPRRGDVRERGLHRESEARQIVQRDGVEPSTVERPDLGDLSGLMNGPFETRDIRQVWMTLAGRKAFQEFREERTVLDETRPGRGVLSDKGVRCVGEEALVHELADDGKRRLERRGQGREDVVTVDGQSRPWIESVSCDVRKDGLLIVGQEAVLEEALQITQRGHDHLELGPPRARHRRCEPRQAGPAVRECPCPIQRAWARGRTSAEPRDRASRPGATRASRDYRSGWSGCRRRFAHGRRHGSRLRLRSGARPDRRSRR